MTDPISLGFGAISATKSAFEVAKGIVDVRDATKLAAVRLELMNLLLEAQQSEAALIAEKRELAERVRQLEAWDGEKQRYELKDIGNGCMAYTLKAEAAGSDPPHSLCANCYSQGSKSILAPFHIGPGRADAMQCHACGSEMIVRGIDGRESARNAAKRPAPKPAAFRY